MLLDHKPLKTPGQSPGPPLPAAVGGGCGQSWQSPVCGHFSSLGLRCPRLSLWVLAPLDLALPHPIQGDLV